MVLGAAILSDIEIQYIYNLFKINVNLAICGLVLLYISEGTIL